MLEQRIEGRRDDASDADAEILRKQLAIDPGALTWARIDSADSGARAAILRRIN
jgi:predicted kinase